MASRPSCRARPASPGSSACLRRTPICVRSSQHPAAANVALRTTSRVRPTAIAAAATKSAARCPLARRLKRVFNIDVSTGGHRGGTLRIVASIEQPTAIRAIPARGHPCLAHFAKHGALEKTQQRCWCEQTAHLECIGGSFDGANDLCTPSVPGCIRQQLDRGATRICAGSTLGTQLRNLFDPARSVAALGEAVDYRHTAASEPP